MSTPSPNYGWPVPIDGGDADTWGAELDTALNAIDAALSGKIDGSNLSGSSGAVVVALPSTFRAFKLFLRNITPVNNGDSLRMRLATDGIPTFLSGATDYNYAISYKDNTGTARAAFGSGAGQDHAFLTGTSFSNAGGTGNFVEIDIMPGISGQTAWLTKSWHYDGSNYVASESGGSLNKSIPATHMQLTFTTGSVATGLYWALYGIPGL
jgi:hypothetical protein